MIGTMLRTRRRTSPRLMAATVVCAAGLAGTDCSDGNEPSIEAGQYSLVSINGQTLPVTIPNTQLGTVVVQSGSVTLTPATAGDSTYTASVLGTVNGEAGTVLADAGRYSRSGSTVTFTSTTLQGFVYAGTLINNQLTITVPGESIGATGTIILELRK
jgi:hypothetical protein